MKLSPIFITIPIFFLISVVSAAADYAAPMIRAAYFHRVSPEEDDERLRQLKKNGINTALVAERAYQIDEKAWQAWGMMAGKYDIDILPVISFAVPDIFRNLPGSCHSYTTREGIVLRGTPCPLDEKYWELVIGKRFEQFAELSRHVPLAGVVFDSEMYESEISVYHDLCYCDVCWHTFFDSRHHAYNLPKEDRFAYLAQHQLLQQFTTFQWEQVQQILSHIKQRVRKIDPDFRLGFLGYRDSWFFRALVLGLGTEENPALVFSESSYVRGYTPYVDQERDTVHEYGTIARYIPGLWLNRFFPHDLPSQLVDLAVHTDGYWLYPADNLWPQSGQLPPFPLYGTPQQYWENINKANQELDRVRPPCELYERTIPPIQLSSFYESSQQHLRISPTLKQLSDQILSGNKDPLVAPISQQSIHACRRETDRLTALQGEALYQQQTLFHSFKSQGKSGSIRITYVPLTQGPDIPIHYMLFDDGYMIQEGQVEYNECFTLIMLPTNLSGCISLLTDAGRHAVQVSFQGVPYTIEASSTFPLTTVHTSRTYAVPITPEHSRVKLRAYCPAGEAASLTVWSTEESVQQTLNMIGSLYGFSEMSVPVSSSTPFMQNKEDVLNISMTPIASRPFASLRFYLYDHESPYLWVQEENQSSVISHQSED